MMQKKVNVEYEKAMIDSQPPAYVYKQHPEREDVMQRFVPEYKLDEAGKRTIHLGDPEASFRECSIGERHDVMIFNAKKQALSPYKKL